MKDTFFILPITLFNNGFTILFHYLLPSSNVIIPSFQNFLSFWAKNCSWCLLHSSRELKIFPLREFCQNCNNGHPKVQCLMNMVDESELPSQAVTVFAWSSKKHGLMLSWWKIVFSVDEFWMLFVECCFQLV